jgi:RNA 2',3'-cyclic 3'-phosphodiesterase
LTRAFIAIRPPESVLDAIEARLAVIEFGDMRRSPREQWHITVQFLGNEVEIDGVIDALQGLTTPAATVRLQHSVGLGNPKRDRVLALTLGEGREFAVALAGEVNTRLRRLGYEPDGRDYVPHLTIARSRGPARREIRDARQALGLEPVGDSWRVGEIVVYESRLGRGPAEHVERMRIPLSNA